MTTRLANRMRAYVVAYAAACCAFLTAFAGAAIAHHSATGTAIALAAIFLSVATVRRFLTISVRADADELIVRGFVSTRTIARRSIEGFAVGGRPGETPGVRVYVKVRGGDMVSLSATGWYFRSREDVELLRSALEEWLTQRRGATRGPH